MSGLISLGYLRARKKIFFFFSLSNFPFLYLHPPFFGKKKSMPSKKKQQDTDTSSSVPRGQTNATTQKPAGKILTRKNFCALSFPERVNLIRKYVRKEHIRRLAHRQRILHTGDKGISFARDLVAQELIEIYEKAHHLTDCALRKTITGVDLRRAAKLNGIPLIISN